MSKPIIAALVLVPLAFAQRPIEFSAKIGVPIADSFDTSHYNFLGAGASQGYSDPRRYTAGAGLVWRLPHGFGAEIDFLYKRLGYDLNSSGPGQVVAEHTWTTANSWEFPMLAVYRLPRFAHVTPRLLGGVSFRAVSGASTTGQCYPLASLYSQFCPSVPPVAQPPDSHLSARSAFGGTLGTGVEKQIGPVRLDPELRYTRWHADSGASGSLFDLRSNPNQLDFLLGINF